VVSPVILKIPAKEINYLLLLIFEENTYSASVMPFSLIYAAA
jgi:hypothetical protein